MKDDPKEIAEHLIQEHGIQGAKNAVNGGIAEANRQNDFYRLSIWREVRKILNDR